MIRRLLTIVFLLIPAATQAQTYIDSLECLTKAFVHVESRGKSTAVGDNGSSVGVLQLKKIMVDEVNRCIGVGLFSYDDRKDSAASCEIFKSLMIYKNPALDVRKACKIWNPRHGTAYFLQINAEFRRNLDKIKRKNARKTNKIVRG